MDNNGSKVEYIESKHVPKNIKVYNSKYLLWNKCLFLTFKEYKEQKFIPKNFYYDKGITNDVDTFITNSLKILSSKISNGKIPEPIYVIYAKKLEYDGTILGKCYDDVANGITNPSSCDANDNIATYKFISNNIKDEKDQEKLKNSNLSKFVFKGNYEVYIYYPSLNTNFKYFTNYYSYMITNSWMSHIISNSMLYEILEVENKLDEIRDKLKKTILSNVKGDIDDKLNNAKTQILSSPFTNLFNYKTNILELINYNEDDNRNEVLNNLLHPDSKNRLKIYIKDELIKLSNKLNIDIGVDNKTIFLLDNVFTSLIDYKLKDYKINDNEDDIKKRINDINTIILTYSFNNISNFIESEFTNLRGYMEDLIIVNYNDNIELIVEKEKKNFVNNNRFTNENYNKCKTDGVVCDYSEDYDEIIPAYTPDETAMGNNIKAKSPYFPTKSLLTNYYEDEMFKVDDTYYNNVKKNLNNCVDNYQKNLKKIGGELGDVNELNKTEFYLIDELKKCYLNHRQDIAKPVQEDGKYLYADEYNKNILLELSKRHNKYPGIQEIVFPVFVLNTSHPDINNYTLRLPWGNKLFTYKYILGDTNAASLKVNKKIYSFNNDYSLVLNKNGVVYVYNEISKKIAYVVNNKIIDSSSKVINVVLDQLGSLILKIRDSKGNEVVAWSIKVFNITGNKGPFSLILENDGNIKIYGEKFSEATNEEFVSNMDKSKKVISFVGDNFDISNMTDFDIIKFLSDNSLNDLDFIKRYFDLYYNKNKKLSDINANLINDRNKYLYIKNEDLISKMNAVS